MYYTENLRNYIRTRKNVGLEIKAEKRKHRKVLNKTGNVRII
jgi:hypothetical protein